MTRLLVAIGLLATTAAHGAAPRAVRQAALAAITTGAVEKPYQAEVKGIEVRVSRPTSRGRIVYAYFELAPGLVTLKPVRTFRERGLTVTESQPRAIADPLYTMRQRRVAGKLAVTVTMGGIDRAIRRAEYDPATGDTVVNAFERRVEARLPAGLSGLALFEAVQRVPIGE